MNIYYLKKFRKLAKKRFWLEYFTDRIVFFIITHVILGQTLLARMSALSASEKATTTVPKLM